MIRVWGIAFLMALSFNAYSQESNCGDGIDNDGDGFIDCFDNDCAGNVLCKDFYVGGDKLCQATPLQFPSFKMKRYTTSSDRTAHTLGRIAIGDLDRDGIPEVVSLHPYDKKLYILNGNDLSTKHTGTITGTGQYDDVAIGNIKNDNCAEIFIAEESGGKWYITSYDCKAQQLWRVEVYGQPFTLGLADFDGDGKVELYYRNEILDAETGTILIKGSGDWTKIDAGPVAVDMLDDGSCSECPGLELVLGGTIYAVDLTPRTANAGALILQKTIPLTTPGNFKYHPKQNDWGYVNTSTSVADYNLDGYLDVLISGAAETYRANGSVDQTTKGTTTVYFWDVKNNTSKAFQPPNNWARGTGRLNIADIDGNGKQNTTFVTGSRLYALDENFNQLWVNTTIVENTSGFTGTTVFDFNNDGAVETVYRDEANLYIIDGKTGNFLTSTPCKSRTANEYPIVADVNGDGVTEICITCNINDNTDISNSDNQRLGHIRTYTSDLEAWVPARKVWNQHAYFNVNVNDDLSIPRVQQKHHNVFSTSACQTGPGSTGAHRPLNTFLNQSAYLDSKGCATYASPDLNFVPNSIAIQAPTCPDQNFTVSFSIQNSGDNSLSGSLPITFYSGNPQAAGAVKLNTTTINLTQLGVGDTYAVSNMTVNGTGNTFTMYAVLNDAGTTVPTPIQLPNSSFVECNYDNNIVSAQIIPGPFSIQTNLISDNFKCGAGTGIPNGAVEAYRLVGSVKETVNYNFYWFNGATVGDTTTAVFKGAVWTGLTEGTYSVVAYHKGFRCGSGAAQVTVGVQTRAINVTLIDDKPFTKCKNPDGKMTAIVNGGDPVGNFTYEWFKGTIFGTSPTLSKSHVITNLDGETYSVLVTDKATGCQTIASLQVSDQTIRPVVTASATDANCNPSNSGSVSANVGGNTASYNFFWYSGTSIKPSPDYTGSTVNGLTAGNYVVVAEDKSTECTSLPVLVTISSKTSPTVTASVTQQQTSCTLPNGAASASVNGSTAGFSFRWYRGNSTLLADRIGTAATITGLAAGTYTAEAFNSTTGCADTELITILDNISIPTVATSIVSHQTNCAPLNGSVSANANGSAGPFQYYWFNGNVGTPDTLVANFKGANYTVLQAGYYTAVAVDKITRCISARSLVQVLNNTVLPTITASSVDQTSCDSTIPNGQLSANIGGSTTGYTFTWYAGSGTGGAVVANAATVSGRIAGVYTVRAVNTSTGCSNTAQVSIINNMVNPVVTANVNAHQTICSAGNGQVSANVSGATAGYTFYWFNGNISTPNIAAPDFTGAVYANRTAGFYTVVAVDNNTKCQSVKATVQVLNNAIPPVIASAKTDQTSCDSGAPNGQASANVGGVTAGYSFEWYAGATASGTVLASSSSLTNRAAGTYTVKVTDDATGCFSTAQVTIINNMVNPVVATNIDAHQTICSSGNGQVSANVAGATAGYTFYWFNGNISTPNIAAPDFNGALYANRVAGFYTVVAVDNNTKCQSVKATVQVLNNAVPPVIATAKTDQTSCDSGAPNGQGSANVGGVTAGYSFEWYAGSAASGTVLGSAASLTNRAAGTYTVKVTDDATGCFSIAQVTIINNMVNPVVATNIDAHQTICSSGNGQVSANVSGATAGYTFYWFNGNISTPNIAAPDFTGALYANRIAGFYTVVAVDNNTKCQSVKATVQVLNNAVPPVIATAKTDQTSCDSSAPNGQASANVGGVTAGYSFEWYAGSAASGTVLGSAPSLTNRAAGTYTVKVTDDATGCFSIAQVTIINNMANPVVATNIDAHQTICSSGNGQVSANVSGATAGYTFYWFNGNISTPNIAAPDFTGALYANRIAGFYTVVAVDNNTKCQSVKVTVQVLNNALPPVIATAKTDQTSCDSSAPNGQASANVGGVTAGYSFQWYAGSAASGTVLGSAASLTNRAAGPYTVKVTDDATGCFSTAQVTIINNMVNPVVATNIDAHQTICSSGNGQVSANVSGATAGYTFYWFNGNISTPNIAAPDFTGDVYANRTAGFYTVVAVDNNTKCQSTKATVQVLNNAVPPAITTAKTDQTSCDSSAPNGQASANVGGVTAGYSFEWYAGSAASGTVLGSAASLTNRAAGTYTVKVTDDATGCFSTAQVTIINNMVNPAVATNIDAHQTICSSGNGQVSANVAGATAGYTFYWFNGNISTPNIASPDFTGAVYANRVAGFYTVVAVDNNTKCLSVKATVQVLDNTVLPIVSTTPTSNTACDPTKSNGVISANVGGVTTNHTFHIFSGQNTFAINEVTGSPAALVSALPSGIYTVQAIDNTTGCKGTTEVTINNNITLPTINAIAADVTSCSPPNGSITANITNGIGNISDYTFSWYDGKQLKASADYTETSATLNDIPAGFYTVSAFNNVLGCDVQTPFTVEVKNDPSTLITINELIGEQNQPAVCNDGQGQLGAEASSPLNASGFSFSWYAGDKNTGMTFEGNGLNFPVNANRISNAASGEPISSGIHTVIALDNSTGCQDSLSIHLPYSDEAALLSVLTFPQTDCLNPDGAFEATIEPSLGTSSNPANAGLDQGWYAIQVWQNGVNTITVPGTVGTPITDPIIVTGLATGNYTVLAVETSVPPLPGCTSLPNNINIGDNRAFPVIIADALIDNKNCIGSATGNGSIVLDIDGASPPAPDYTYTWYDGKLTSDPTLPGNNLINNIDGGFYTVEVTNINNNCLTKETFSINNDPYILSIPAAELLVTDQTDCSPVNGSGEVTDAFIDGVTSGGTFPTDFSFSWFENDGTTTIPSSGNAALIGSMLAADQYFVRATNNISNCSTPLTQFSVGDLTSPPDIDALVVDNTFCSGFTPNGSITLNINGGADPLSDFTIEWFEDAALSVSLGTNGGTISGGDNEIAQDLSSGTYYVRVTDNVTAGASCSAVASFTVIDNLPIVNIDQANINVTDQADCSPADGLARVMDIIVDGTAVGSTVGYSFNWFESDGTTPVAGAGNADLIAVNLVAGDYFVQAVSTTSNCSTSIVPFSVEDVHIDPTIIASAIVDNANCTGSTPNGSITLTIEVNGVVTPLNEFNIEWFEDAAMTTALGTNVGVVAGTDNEIAQQLGAGTYYIRVTDITSPNNNCSATASFAVNDNPPVISIDQANITVTDQANCSPTDGLARVMDIIVDGAAVGSTVGYSFNWFESDGTTPIAGAGNADLIAVNLAAGDYFVQAVNTTSNCSTSIVPFSVEDVHIDPTIIASAIVDNANCTGSTPNGSITLTIEVNGVVTPLNEFNFEWFEDAAMTTALGTNVGVVAGTDNEIAQQLGAGTYYIRVTDITSPNNNCSATASFAVNDNPPVISIDQANITVTDQANCSPTDGLARVMDIIVDGAAVGSTAGYSFNWFESDGITPVAGAGNADLIAVNLAAGDYFVQAVNTTSNCSTSIVPFSVEDVHIDPTIIASAIVDNANCTGSTPNGSITLTIEVNGVVTPLNEFNIEWFEDAAMTTALGTNVGVVAGTDNEIAQQLGAGTYYIRVTDITSPNNNCSATASFAVNDNPPVISIDQANITVTDQANCSPADGLARVMDIIVDGAAVGSTAGYSFNWFESDGTTPIAGAGNADLIAVNLAAGDYFVQAVNTTSNCSTSIVPFSVEDVHIDPTIIASAIVDNANCTGSTPNGSITLTIEVNGVVTPLNEFNIEWFEDAAMTTALGTNVGVVAGTDNEIAQQLGAGTYYIRVTDITSPNNNCSATASFAVNDNPPVISIDQANITVTDQANCSPTDGLARVMDIIVDGAAVGSTVGYSFNWFESDGTTPTAGAGNADLIAVNLAAGDYFVQAVNTTSNCSTSIVPFSVEEVHIDPTIIASAIVDNANCTGSTPNGSITLTIEVNGVVTPLNEFNFEWFEDAAMTTSLGTNVGVVAGTDNEIAQQLGAGTYYIRVTDITSPNNNCSATAFFTISDDLPIISIDPNYISITDQSDCTPVDGNANVINIAVDNATLGNTLGYSFEWFESDGTTPIAGSGNTAIIGVLVGAGNYFVQATNISSNCSSPIVPFTINDVTVTPTIVAVQNFPNISCDINYTGELSATVSEGTTNGITAGYQFAWFRGANNTNPADFIALGTTISNLQDGDYTVQVTDQATPGNGCLGTVTITLKREIPILNATLAVNNQTVCLPVNGSINVISIQQILMGTTTVFDMSDAAALANFSFQWFDENLNPVTGIINGSAASPNLLAGTYYVQVTNALGCATGFTRAVIEDTTVHPDVVLNSFTNPSVCILPEATGTLNIIADNSINFSDYTFTWYDGNDASGAVVVPNNPSLNNITYSDPMTYTVRVTRNATNCYSDATFTFATDTVQIRAIASAVPLTNCVTPNGSLFSTVQNGTGLLYDYEWYTGTTVGTTPAFTTNEVLIAPIGTYTVVARHPTLNFCESIPSTVEVFDGRIYPLANINLKAPLTYCDPAKANGVARADVNGSVTNHIFEWYKGSATGNLVYIGSEAGSLRATTYYVKAIDIISGCDNTASIVIPNEPINILTPQVEVLAEKTDCLNPNGILSASVNGNTQDYSFYWYNGTSVKNQPDVVSETYYDLYAGPYTVTAFDRVSGCVSMPVNTNIAEILSYPEFEVLTTAANCDEMNGRAEVKTTNDVNVSSIEWDIDGLLEYGAILGDLQAGTYSVTVVSQLNCSTTEQFIVEPDITVYNGISRNNDGDNDIFEIGCINDFLNNTVKIFNRAGTLVYEAKYYDNEGTFFNGVSNRGINLLGNELPSGTYFYIIDKGNGSKPKTGYLELMQ